MTPLLEIAGLVRTYPAVGRSRHGAVPVLHGVSLSIAPGGALGLVGESGSGKSTLARTVLALERPQAGTVRLEGVDLFAAPAAGLRRLRRRMQAVFQDPNGSLDPRMRVGRTVAEPMVALEADISARQRRERVRAALDEVGLPADAATRYPHQFSGGQRQRIAIARALVTRPALIVADEPVSALDVSMQAQVLDLIARLRGAGIGWLFISHDLAVVRAVCDEAAVLLRGHVVERGPAGAMFAAPRHPYTATLVAAATGGTVDPRPDAADPTRSGCPHAAACPIRLSQCAETMPPLRALGAGRSVACHAVVD